MDLLITNNFFDPLVAFEIDGSGHNRSDLGKIYDEVKDRALESAGIQIFRINAHDDQAEHVKEQVRTQLRQFFGMDASNPNDNPPS